MVKKQLMISNVTVVVRSVGERTEKLCLDILKKQVLEKNIFILRNVRPFSEAVKQNFEIGVKQKLKWTLSIDADVLLTEGAIQKMVQEFEKLEESYYVYKGLVFDKYFNDFRSAGVHMYRTSLLKKAIEFIPEEGTNLRPESHTYREMVKIGFHTYNDTNFYGLHDFGQSYFDIYRKFFTHAKKHKNNVATFLNLWKDNLNDKDYLIALRGLCDGLLFNEIVYIDYDFFIKKYNVILEELGLKEKEKNIIIEDFNVLFKEVNNKLNNGKVLNKNVFDTLHPLDGEIYKPSIYTKFKKMIKRKLGYA